MGGAGLPIGGLSGFAQGGILEALKRPIISDTVETFKYGRKGSVNEGKVIEHRTRVKEFSVGDAVIILLVGGIIYVAADKGIRAAIWDAITPLGILPDLEDVGVVADVVKDAIDPLGLFELSVDEKSTLIDVFKNALDPFNLFD